MITEQQALELLNGMGKTADEVAAFLTEKGIKGNHATGFTCPVNNYLISQGGETTAAIYEYYVCLHIVMLVPKPVYKFIRAFDDGKYPELENT